MKKKVNLIKTEVGNIGSVMRVINDLEYDVNLVSKKNEIDKNFKIILPGVGNFDTFINSLKINNLYNEIKKYVLEDKIKLLGICVGMQSLFATSEEGEENGFGFINAECKKFVSNSLKVPHIGWNEINEINNSVILDDVKKKLFYFAHSFHVDTQIEERYVLAKTRYSYDFPSIICKNNIYGVQFHPEKSSNQGHQIFKNFLEKC